MDHLVPHVAVEQRLERLDVGDLPVLDPEAGGIVHPAVHGDHEEGPGDAGDDDREPAENVHARRQPIPAVDVDRDMKMASRKNEKPSRPKATPNTSPNVAMNSGHSSPSSKDRIVPVTTPIANRISIGVRPALGQRLVERVSRPQPQSLEEDHHRREGDAETDKRDVHGQRQRLHLSGLERYSCSTGPPRMPSTISRTSTRTGAVRPAWRHTPQGSSYHAGAHGSPLVRHRRCLRRAHPGRRQGDALPDPDGLPVLVRLHSHEHSHDQGAGELVAGQRRDQERHPHPPHVLGHHPAHLDGLHRVGRGPRRPLVPARGRGVGIVAWG